jgi:hypothetical protein
MCALPSIQGVLPPTHREVERLYTENRRAMNNESCVAAAYIRSERRMEVGRVTLAGEQMWDSVLHLVRVAVIRRSQGCQEYSFWPKPKSAGV